MMFVYFFVFFVHFVIVLGESEIIKQNNSGIPFNLKCPTGSFVSSILSTYNDSAIYNDRRSYTIECTNLKSKVPKEITVINGDNVIILKF